MAPHPSADLSPREYALAMHARFMPSLSDFQPDSCMFNILHHNADSIFPKVGYYTSLPNFFTYDAVSISETWLKPTLSSAMLELPQYQIFRTDRSPSSAKSQGGGALILLKKHFNAQCLSELPSQLTNCESVWIKVKPHNSNTLIIGSIYLAPDSDKNEFLLQLSNLLENKIFDTCDLIICGDFNINWNKNSMAKKSFSEIADNLNMSQVVSGFTYTSHRHASESLLDLAFLTRSVSYKSTVLTTDISDHYAVALALQIEKNRQPRVLVRTRNYSRGLHKLQSHEAVPNEKVIADVHSLPTSDLQAEYLENWVQSIVDQYMPVRQVRVRPSSPKWLTNDLRRLVAAKNRMYRRIRHHPDVADLWTSYKKLRSLVKSQILLSKKNYYQDQLSQSPSSFYKQVNSLLGKEKRSQALNLITSSSGLPLTDPHEIANEFNTFFTNISTPNIVEPTDTFATFEAEHRPTNYFTAIPVSESQVALALSKLSPFKRGGVAGIPAAVYQRLAYTVVPSLVHIINTSIETSTFPKTYKQAIVTPIFKKGEVSQLGNYRPISSLPILSKIFEFLLNRQVIEHLDRFNLLSAKQFGFRKGISAEQLILSVTDQYNQILDSKQPRYIVHLSLDVRKAFDSVNHNLLLYKLRTMFHFSESAVNLFGSYLSCRSQCMKVGAAISQSLPIHKGVPQGSVLGPLLFNLMVNDMLESNHNVLSYADDTLLFETADTASGALALASKKYSALSSWYTSNGLSLCVQKTTCLICSNRAVPHNLHLELDGHATPVGSAIRLLGFTLDSKLSLIQHVDQLVCDTSNIIYALRKVRCYLTRSATLTVYITMIRSKLEYCSSVLHCSDLISIASNLEKCQRRAVRVICNVPRNTGSDAFSVTEACADLQLKTLSERRTNRFNALVHHLVAGRGSPYLVQLLDGCDSHARSLRNSCPYVLPYARSSFGKKRFVYRAITALKGNG